MICEQMISEHHVLLSHGQLVVGHEVFGLSLSGLSWNHLGLIWLVLPNMPESAFVWL